MESQISPGKFLAEIPALWSKIALLKNEANEPIEYIRLSNMPGQILLSESERAKQEVNISAGGLYTLNQFLHLVQSEAVKEEKDKEQRESVRAEITKTLEDLKSHLNRMVSACSKAFLNHNPLLQRSPALEFISSYENKLLESPDELENTLRSLGMLFYQKIVEGHHFSNINLVRIKGSVNEFKAIVDSSLHKLLASLKEAGSQASQAPSFEMEDQDLPRRSMSLFQNPSQSVLVGMKSPKAEIHELGKQLTLVQEIQKMPGAICGKGKGITCTQFTIPPICFVLSNEGTLRAFEINPKSYFFKQIFSKKFDLGGEDWSNSISLSPNEAFLAVSGVNSNSIHICRLDGEVSYTISKEENDKTWMFASNWVTNDTIVAGYSDGRLKVFKIGQTKPVLDIKPFYGRVFSLTSKNDGKHIWCGSTSGHVALISTDSLKVEAIERPVTTWIHVLALDEEGKQLACGGDGKEVIIMNALTFDGMTTVTTQGTGEIQSLVWKKSRHQVVGTLYIVTENEVMLVRSFTKGFLGKGEKKWEKVFEVKKATSSSLHSGIVYWGAMMLLVGDEEGCLYKAGIKQLLAK